MSNQIIGLEKAISAVENRLSPATFAHSRRTAAVARGMAELFGCDPFQAEVAAWLHDYAKELDDSALVEQAISFSLPVTDVDLENPYLLHGPVGACLVRRELKLSDKWLFDAIARHTYGDPEMSELDMVVYLADVIEPGRDFAGLGPVRQMAEKDLRAAFQLAYEGQMRFVLAERKPLHPITLEVWNKLVTA